MDIGYASGTEARDGRDGRWRTSASPAGGTPGGGGVFYPRGLPQRRELAHVGERLTSVEVNGSFYSLQRPSSWRAWAAEVPADFVFAVKGPRFLTHMKKLVDVEAPLGTFLASGVLSLGDRLGPFLWQLPPNLGFHPDRLAAFFDLLPRTTADAAAYAAAHHDASKLKEPADTATPADRPLRHVLEVRHQSFRTAEFCELLRAHGIGMVVADSAGTWPMFDEVTSDVAYVRLHGDTELYASDYSAAALDRWAEKVRGWEADGLDVFVYFDNDAKVHAPFDAMALQERLGIPPGGA
ncbi:DUF72 domain-containing protein [Nocardioides eburneiflavus]|uniref:DUF72 domain-containing protein n=1 Tax=Nocardioides eburneiflavus TaxID=2518372 RepID=UPI001FE839DB|nr:DUF72 domain-containing protein [Nocardioides eburneiflavus]